MAKDNTDLFSHSLYRSEGQVQLISILHSQVVITVLSKAMISSEVWGVFKVQEVVVTIQLLVALKIMTICFFEAV